MKIKTITIIITIITLLPLAGLAQFEFLESMFYQDNALDTEINLNSLKLAWSADTYIPFKYQGRTLPTRGSKVTVEALLDVSGSAPENLKYSWFLDDVFQENKSGYGRMSFEFTIRRISGRSHIVSVQIFNESRSFFTEREITIPIVEPEVVIYSSNGNSNFSDEGNKTSLIIAGKKSSFVAKPYFFSIKKLTDLSFEWRFAGHESTISSAYGANVLELNINEKEDDKILERTLDIDIKNKTNSFQKALQTIKVQIY